MATWGESDAGTALTALDGPGGPFVVRAYFTEADAGHTFGPFSTRQAAQECAIALAGRAGVIRVTIEEA